ncbi:MAG: hypothetical protein AB1540_13915 [Bdellovibrionota bacterium]
MRSFLQRLFSFRVNRKIRRRMLIPVLTALAGGLGVLILEWTLFRPRPVQLPVLLSSVSSHPPLGPIAPHELETRMKISPCVDLHTYVCALASLEDPTGNVRRDEEGEVEVLRIYENIIRSNKKLSSQQIDELLVKQVYTPERTRKLRDLFEKAKAGLVHFIDSQPFQALSEYEKQILRARVEKVRLELPPPASVYSDERDLFTRNEVYYERTSDGVVRIRIGGALLFTIESKFNLAFTLAHELAHAIDPCELISDKIDILSYQDLASCFGAPLETLVTECSPKGKLSEIFADWAATHVVAEILAEAAPRFTLTQVRSAVFNTVRDLCRDDYDELRESNSGLSSSHPNVSFRVNRIFAQHPGIRKLLGCRDAAGPTLPGVPSYCFWPTRNNRDSAK